MSEQSELSAGRILTIDTSALGAPSKTTPPQITLAPNTPTGLKTTGFLFFLEAPSDAAAPTSPAVAPFGVTLWIRNPVNGFWAAAQPLTGVGYGEAYVTYDVDAADLYFDITAVFKNPNYRITIRVGGTSQKPELPAGV